MGNRTMIGVTVAVFLVGATLLGAQKPAPPPLTTDVAVREVVFGQADATWMKRAVALIKRDDRAAVELGRVAAATNVDPLARSRALEALARANTPAAKDAIAHAVESRAGHEE
jgi:uncharacterized lipoprotein YajG